MLTFVYGLRPSRAKHRLPEAILEGERLLYNAALQERRDHWRSACARAGRRGRARPDRELDADWYRPLTGLDQFKSLTQIRGDDPAGYGALPANISRRQHGCPPCGLRLHRDHNAALVIRRRARALLAAAAVEELAA